VQQGRAQQDLELGQRVGCSRLAARNGRGQQRLVERRAGLARLGEGRQQRSAARRQTVFGDPHRREMMLAIEVPQQVERRRVDVGGCRLHVGELRP
jgi:hypothetical protein